MGFNASCIKSENKKISWFSYFKGECNFLREQCDCVWAQILLKSFHLYKSEVSQKVYQAQISSIRLCKTIETIQFSSLEMSQSVEDNKRHHYNNSYNETKILKKNKDFSKIQSFDENRLKNENYGFNTSDLQAAISFKNENILEKHNENVKNDENRDENEKEFIKNNEKDINIFENQLLDFQELKTESDRQCYRKSLINPLKYKEKTVIKRSNFSQFQKDLDTNNEKTKKLKDSWKIYQEITEIIEKHLNDEKNVLGYLLAEFLRFLISEMRKTLKSYKISKISFDILKENYKSFVIDIKNFLEILQETLCLFYDLEHIGEICVDFVLITKENLINFLSNILFQEEIYCIAMEFEEILCFEKEKNLENTLKSIENLKIHDFSLPESANGKTNKFQEAIGIFEQLERNHSPILKLKTILNTTDAIIKETSEKTQKIIAGDEIIVFFLYIVAKSKGKKLYSQMNFIERFAGKGLLCTKSGYYFATVQICLNYLEDTVCEDGRLSKNINDFLRESGKTLNIY